LRLSKRKAIFMNWMITANRLSDGVVVFLDAANAWTEDFHLAAPLADEAVKAEALAKAKQSEANNEVIDPYVIDVENRNGHFTPKALREAIRASGPTNRRDLGKQAHGQGPSITLRASVETSHVSL
jgi:Protein of unknown function (DUF2849)